LFLLLELVKSSHIVLPAPSMNITDTLSEWVNGMWSLIQIKIIKKHYAVSMNTCTTSMLKNSNDENFHDKYVVVPASKASNDIVSVSCKPHYIDFDKRIKYVLLFSLFIYNCIVDRDPIIREGGFGSY
jgi:hypothetical protein